MDFICQNWDRLNREMHGMKGDQVVHAFVDPQSSKLIYIDNLCQVRTSGALSAESKQSMVDFRIETRAILEIRQFFNATTKRELMESFGTQDEFMSRLQRGTENLQMGGSRLAQFHTNILTRFKILRTLMIP